MRLKLIIGLLTSIVIACSSVYAAPKSAKDLDLTIVESDLEPSVSIKEYENRVVEEYRVNNNLYMIKINPKAGAPYYLVDDEGTGEMDLKRDSGGRDIVIPRWTLFSW